MRWHYNGIDLGQYISSLHVRTSRRGKTKSNEKTTKVNFGFHSFYSRIFPVNSENPFFITNTFVLKGHWVETRSLLRCQEYKHRLKILNVIWKRILSFCQNFHQGLDPNHVKKGGSCGKSCLPYLNKSGPKINQ